MGTSSKLPGPRGGGWSGAVQKARAWARDGLTEDDAEHTGAPGREAARAYLRALARTLREAPDAFGLRAALLSAGERLITVWERLQEAPATTRTTQERNSDFAARFVDAVAGEGSTVATAAVRRATAGPLLDRLIDGLSEQAAGESPPGTKAPLPDDLFCEIYGLLFSDAVGEFIKTIIAEKIELTVPALYAIDPAAHIASWAAEHVRAVLPLPCEAQRSKDATAPPITVVGRSLLEKTVDRALGIDAPGDGAPS